MDTVRRSASGEDLDLRAGILSSMANEVMPPVVRLFGERHPHTRLHAADLPIGPLVAGVRGATLDVALDSPSAARRWSVISPSTCSAPRR